MRVASHALIWVLQAVLLIVVLGYVQHHFLDRFAQHSAQPSGTVAPAVPGRLSTPANGAAAAAGTPAPGDDLGQFLARFNTATTSPR